MDTELRKPSPAPEPNLGPVADLALAMKRLSVAIDEFPARMTQQVHALEVACVVGLVVGVLIGFVLGRRK